MTTPVFTTPLIAEPHPETLSMLHGANLCITVNSQVQRFPRTTPLKTLPLPVSSFGAGCTFKTREAIAETIAISRQLGIHVLMASIPVDTIAKTASSISTRRTCARCSITLPAARNRASHG
ncbi:hypothetical protein [Dyella sp. EPa41]|uniref:hypothetical protein n=1 Tax=Dyella sp. EPa41 TaxID=1561194 RepID=UPI001915ED59|nr:hypothetical protein [Dyella sp. EPa41]